MNTERESRNASGAGFSLRNFVLKELRHAIGRFGKAANGGGAWKNQPAHDKSEKDQTPQAKACATQGKPEARLPDGRACAAKPRWQFALLVLACFVVAFCAGKRPPSLPTSFAGAPLTRASLAGPDFIGARLHPQLATGLAVRVYDGTNTMQIDPCKGQSKQYASISQTANTQLAAGAASKKIYVCSIHVVVASAANVALVEGTGSVCGTGTAGVSGFGGATAATGWNFGANGGIALGNGDSSLGAEVSSGDNLCLFNSGSGQVSGGLGYVVQ